MSRLDEIENRLRAITEPWKDGMVYAKFIAAAPDDIAWLIARVKELEAQ